MPHYTCPHCQRASFGFLSKWLSSPVVPRVCKHCSGLSWTPGSQGGGVMVVNVLVLTVAGFAASYWQTGWAFAPAIAFALGLSLWRLHLRPIQVLTSTQMALAHKKGLFNALLLGLFSAMQ